MFSPVQPSIFGTVQSTQIFFRKKMERTTGIEPASSAWEADILPMNYVRISSVDPLHVSLSNDFSTNSLKCKYRRRSEMSGGFWGGFFAIFYVTAPARTLSWHAPQVRLSPSSGLSFPASPWRPRRPSALLSRHG